MFGKNIIITDNTDWLTSDIIEASLARWQVEDRFRLSKDHDLVARVPFATDGQQDQVSSLHLRGGYDLCGESS